VVSDVVVVPPVEPTPVLEPVSLDPALDPVVCDPLLLPGPADVSADVSLDVAVEPSLVDAPEALSPGLPSSPHAPRGNTSKPIRIFATIESRQYMSTSLRPPELARL
jgi:hypothetical protein